MPKQFETNKPLDIHTTKIDVWQERDNLQITLRSTLGEERLLVQWIDDAAQEAFRDGFLSAKEAILGNLGRNVRQGGALHASALEYWRDTLGSPKEPVIINPSPPEEEETPDPTTHDFQPTRSFSDVCSVCGESEAMHEED